MGSSPPKSRIKSLHDEAYAAFVEMIVELRMKSGLKQWQVAKALGWNQSVVSKIETRQRRIDVIEFIRVAEVVGFDAVSLVRRIQKLVIK